MRGSQFRPRGVIATWLLGLIIAPGLLSRAVAQDESINAKPGSSPTGIVLSGGKRSEEALWIGERQHFQVFVNVSEGANLLALDLVIDYPKSGVTRHEAKVADLSEQQRAGKDPVVWDLPFNTDGQYTAHFEAKAVGAPDVIKEPKFGALSFRVKNFWMHVGGAVGFTLLMLVITRFGISLFFSRLKKRKQMLGVYASLFFFLLTTWLGWTYLVLAFTAPITWGVAALLGVVMLGLLVA
jgi:hypothetical protein